jgi:hypothetical protein
MQQTEHKRGLIRDRGGAILVLCGTGVVTAQAFLLAFSDAPYKRHWQITLTFVRLPTLGLVRLPAWSVPAVNGFFYAGFPLLTVAFYRAAHGWERILVVGWLNVVFLGPFQNFISTAGVDVIRWIQACGMAVASFAAVMILWRAPAKATAPSAATKRGSMIMLGIVLGLLLAGALLYFLP